MTLQMSEKEVRPAWSARALLGAAGWTLLLFCVLPLTHLVNRPDMDDLLTLREVDAAPWPPPPPLPVAEPEPAPTREPEPAPIDVPAPAEPSPSPSPIRMEWAMNLPGPGADFGVAIDPGGWRLEGAVLGLAEVDSAPRPLVQAPPLYPHAARQSGLEGEVELEFVVTEQGTVTEVHVLASRPGTVFVNAARSAVERWRFEPARRDGEPVAVRVSIPVEFKLDR